MFHFNNNFDIVYGSVKDCEVTPPLNDFTQYTVVYDLTNLKAYYRTYEDQQIVLLGCLKPKCTTIHINPKKDYQCSCKSCLNL
jgi:choloylglycine hydrolase